MAHDDDLLDELASAYLDGEVTPDERAWVEADPELLARVERLREVRTVLAGDVDRLDRSGFDDMRLRALAALDEDGAGVDEPVADAVPAAAAVTSLEMARQRKASRIWKPLVAVAGAAAIGVAAISGVANLSADDDSDQSSTATEETFAASAEAATADDQAAKDAAGGGSAADTATPETIGEIDGAAEIEGGAPLAADSGAEQIGAPAPAGAAETTAAAAAEQEEATATPTTATTSQHALATEDEVIALATDARDQLAAGASPPRSSSECPDLGLRWDVIVWRGTTADLYLATQPGGSELDVAIVATEDCTVLLSVTLP